MQEVEIIHEHLRMEVEVLENKMKRLLEEIADQNSSIRNLETEASNHKQQNDMIESDL